MFFFFLNLFLFRLWVVDRVFGEDCKTLDVYQARTKDIVAAAVHGFNGTLHFGSLFIYVFHFDVWKYMN